MTPAYTAKLGLTTWKTSVEVLKIDSLSLKTYGMASAKFPIQFCLESSILQGDFFTGQH